MQIPEKNKFNICNRLSKLCNQAELLLYQQNASPLPLIIEEVNKLLTISKLVPNLTISKKVKTVMYRINRVAKKRGFRHKIIFRPT